MKITIWPVMFSLISGIASAQEAQSPIAVPTDYQPCLLEQDDAKRLTCFDHALSYIKPDIPAKSQPKPKPTVSILVRQQANFDTFGGQDLMGKPGQLMFNQSDGKETSTVKLGLIGAFRPINALGWQPYIATAWNRDTTGKTPSDLRDVVAGITGPLWDAVEPGWTISPNVRLRHRTDLYGKQDSDAVVVHGNLIILPWVKSVPGTDRFSFVFVPYFGAQDENRNGGADNGLWTSDYIGMHLNADLNMILPRLSIAATIQQFHDITTPAGATHRSEKYESTSLSYALTDPEDKTVTVRPALTIERDVGNDLLSGNGKQNKTAFGITVLVN